jgi:catechol 2,3-dioxygenase-like lactoylglutathione lyase family enzyme
MARIDHVNIVVADLERSIRFYEEFLGLRRGFERTLKGEWVERVTGLAGAHAECVFMDDSAGGARLELLHYRSPQGAALAPNSAPQTQGIRHLAFALDSPAALSELAGRLRSAGWTVISDPVEVPFRVGSLGAKRLFYFLDPDGVVLEAAAYGAEP